MAGHLLLLVLMYSFSLIKAQALLPPKLTVNPPVITETDSVTLNCQTPSSVSVSHCHFNTVRGGSVRASSCLKTLTGTELLNMAHQSSPAVVEVTCYYTVNGEFSSTSPHSHISYIVINKGMIQMIGAGVTLGVLVLGLVLLFNQSRFEKCVSQRSKSNITGKSKSMQYDNDRKYMAAYDETYSIVTYDCNIGDREYTADYDEVYSIITYEC
ncbi:uncharacterized protein LOC108886525 isoform X2 [Lates calcarifer]|nr:uncharacterized protein LOC108886525 isoform X2 [Lates calcarifer]